MPFSIPIMGMRGYGKLTQNAGTVITRLVEPMPNAFTRIVSVWYTASTTAHTLTVMRPLNVVTFTAAASAGQAVVNISADPGDYTGIRTSDNAIAGSDFVVYEVADGTYALDTVSSVATLAVTLSNNVPTSGVLAGGKLWFYGIITDTNPLNAQAHPQFTLPASVTTYLGTDSGEGIAGFVGSIAPPGGTYGWPTGTGINLTGRYEPLIVHSGNATAAGTIEKVTAIYTNR